MFEGLTHRAGTRSLDRMAALTLVTGSRNYSAWSLRPWLLLRHLGIEFAEHRIPLDTPEFEAEIGRFSPTRRVPVLIHGELMIWESLAICEYISELAGGHGWPAAASQRAHARALSAEMHSGFGALRSACPMNARATGRRVPMTRAVAQDLRRIDAIWSGCRRDHGERGPWLFGEFGIADAMYAPVALRVRTYGLPLSSLATRYYDTVIADRHVAEWIAESCRDTQVIPHDEAGVGA
jgi:glutathione S-transferase